MTLHERTEINPAYTLGPYSTDPQRPDYACPDYRKQMNAWQIVEDVREGTEAIRAKKETYLPRFEAEDRKKWLTRVAMSFMSDAYALTLEEHVGLVMAEPPRVGEDVPKKLQDLVVEDFDGQGSHLDLFAADALDAAFHFGHAVIWTDYPDTTGITNLAQKRASGARPYAVLYEAPDVLNWRTRSIGGALTLTMITFRDREDSGRIKYRRVEQEVHEDKETGRVTGLGPVTWSAWWYNADAKDDEPEFSDAGSGTIVGPDRIPARVVYGGQRRAPLVSRPHLKSVAYTSLEEVQVQSDYASVMHKCNVPTPVFIGRRSDPGDEGVVMGEGMDLDIGGSAMMLEPSGVALSATRDRLGDLGHRMQRQGATTSEGAGKALTATEAAMVAKSRNAKLARAGRSLEDGLEGTLADMAAFENIAEGGGSLEVLKEFAGTSIDPAYLNVLVMAYREGGLPLDALLYALQKGNLPEDFKAEEEALRLLATAQAAGDVEEEAA